MPDYKPTPEAGHAWLQPSSIIVSNPRGEPVLQFNEEEVTALGAGKALSRPYGPLVAAYEAELAIPVLDPATGLETGQVTTLAAVLAGLHSAYVAIAKRRDAPAEDTPAA